MPDYRVYPLRNGRGFAPPEEFVARNDAEAFVSAEGLYCPLGYEIWSGLRLVAVVQRPHQETGQASPFVG
jgi:hypothetical protein